MRLPYRNRCLAPKASTTRRVPIRRMFARMQSTPVKSVTNHGLRLRALRTRTKQQGFARNAKQEREWLGNGGECGCFSHTTVRSRPRHVLRACMMRISTEDPWRAFYHRLIGMIAVSSFYPSYRQQPSIEEFRGMYGSIYHCISYVPQYRLFVVFA